MPCEICGKETRVQLTNIKGAKLYVCMDCNPTGDGVVKRVFEKYNNNSNKNQLFRKPASLIDKEKEQKDKLAIEKCDFCIIDNDKLKK